jgi:hypothetical protein
VIVINRFYMCKKDGESIDHLLHDEVAHALWCNIFSRLGLSWVMPSSVLDQCASWCSSCRTRSALVWKMLPICIFWTIWRERNIKCFEDLESFMEEILASLLYSCICGLLLTFPLCLLATRTFFPVFLFLVRRSSCIYPMYFWGALRFLIKSF